MCPPGAGGLWAGDRLRGRPRRDGCPMGLGRHQRIHLVDLDGARSGRPVNVEAVKAILSAVDVPCQIGGGIRSDETAEAWLASGIERVIVGTQALKDPAWFRALVLKHPHRVVLGLDARGGLVATDGWLDVSNVPAIGLAEQFDDLPLAAVVYTEIARDGMLEGPDLPATGELAGRIKTPVIASGGVGSLEDLDRLAGLPIAGVIVGRALYEGRFRLSEAIK